MAPGRARLLTSCALLSLLCTALVGVSAAHAADANDCPSFAYDVLQRVNPASEANLLTRSTSEAGSAAQRYGYTVDMGVIAKVAGSAKDGLTPIWRMYKPGDFVWAADGSDADAFVDDGYAKQFIEFYAATNPVSCLNPIDRFEKDGVHRLANPTETNALLAAGWTYQDVAFYAAASGSPEPPPPPDSDTKFSVAAIPDTQNEVTSPTDTRMINRNTWLAGQKSALDLRYAVQIGDLVNWGNVVPSQFDKASNDMKPLEAAMPWAGVIGSHDTAAVCVGGSACPGANANLALRNTSAYNKAFPVSRFPNIKGTFEPGKVDNAYATFSAGGVNWMVLTLELWPRTAVVDWAKDVVRDHPTDNVIVATHAYLDSNGSISASNGGYGATSPRYLYDNLIKLYPNVKLVLSGHVGQAASRTDVGVNGNKILSLLQTFHSSTNPVRLIEIDTAAGTVTSHVYAPGSHTDYPAYTTSTTGMTFG